MIYPNCSYSTEHNENNARVCPAPPDPDGSIYGVWKVTSCQVRRRKFPYSITTRIKHVAKQNVIKLLVISVQCAKDCLERVKPIRESNQDCLKLESARASLSEERKRVSIFFLKIVNWSWFSLGWPGPFTVFPKLHIVCGEKRWCGLPVFIFAFS